MLLDELYQLQNYSIISIPLSIIYPATSYHALPVEFQDKENQINVVVMQAILIFDLN